MQITKTGKWKILCVPTFIGLTYMYLFILPFLYLNLKGIVFQFIFYCFSWSQYARTILFLSFIVWLVYSDYNSIEGRNSDDAEGGAKVWDNEEDQVAYSWTFFHLMFALATLYVMMTVTNWYK